MTTITSRRGMRLRVLQLQWGWITPGTCASHRRGQWDAYRRFLARPVRPESLRLLLLHCGWWLDAGASAWLRDLTRRNPEPNRSLQPCRGRDLAFLRAPIRSGRIEPVGYPYAACVAEATSGEALLRSFRFSLEIMEAAFGVRPRVLMNHDAVYGLDWGCAQMPQVARLLGISLLVAGVNGTVVTPDGTAVCAFGSTAPWHRALQAARSGGKPVFFSMELHQHLRFLDELRGGSLPIRLRAPVETVGLDAYLAENRAPRRLDARGLGTKGWYGGVTDSLLIEQNVKGVELRLPAIEAAAALRGPVPAAIASRLVDLWKGVFVLMDNHALWQCHDYRRHCLPRSARFAREAADLEQRVLGHDPSGRRAFVFNPVPWRRHVLLETPRGVMVARDVPGWGTAEAVRVDAKVRAGGARRLQVGSCRYDLNARGEVVRASVSGPPREFAGLGRLVEVREKPSRERVFLSGGEAVHGLEGSVSVSREVEIPRGWSEAWFSAAVEGEAFLLQVERPVGKGGSEWIALHTLHWGGEGMPRHARKLGPAPFKVRGARRVRLTLWMLAEGRLAVRDACLRSSGGKGGGIPLDRWEARVHYRVDVARATACRAAVVREVPGLKIARFEGELPSARWELFATLREGSGALEYRLRVRFLRPTRLGLSTPPFSEDEGSLLGAQCERPYVPGMAVLFPLPTRARYFSDKPWSLAGAFRESPRTWHTDRRDGWLGISPFIGMNMAVADWGRGRLGLFTRGLKHFFRWKREGAESLGLSLGATIIHPATQGHSVPRTSRFFSLIGRSDHDPYARTRFLRARGIYEFHYAVRPVPVGEGGLARSWRAAQEFALPPSLFGADDLPDGLAGGVNCAPEGVVLSALEPRGRNGWVARLVNLEGRPREFHVALPGLGKSVAGRLPAHGVREFPLRGLRMRA